MVWDHRQLLDYIKKSAPVSASTNLLKANFKAYRTNGLVPAVDRSPRLFITYYSMPDWLDLFTFQAYDLPRTPFASMVGRYQQSALNHQAEVGACLDEIASIKSGQALLTEISSTPFSVYVMPYYAYKRLLPYHDFFNSTSRGIKPRETLSYIMDGFDLNFADEYARGAPERDEDGQIVNDEKGTGKGTNVVLYYSAEIWRLSDAPQGPGFKSDEVLFHELVHIARMLRGKVTSAPVIGSAGFGNIEEYLATVLANIYISEKWWPGQTPLRGIYNKEGAASVLKDPDHFASNAGADLLPKQLMDIFKNTQPAFYSALAHLPKDKPKFNPAGQHFRGEDDNQIPI